MRPSGTEPLVRVMVEAPTEEEAEEVCGRLVALLDNLGKGASGAAVQNLNLMFGLPEATGLDAAFQS